MMMMIIMIIINRK